jgi:hypothetical protein
MKDFFSTFGRFATSLACGALTLFGIYLITGGIVYHTGATLDAFVQGKATSTIFSIALFILAYMIGIVVSVLSTAIFHRCRPEFDNALVILDEIESRGNVLLTQEFSDLIAAKRLVLSSAFPLLLIATGIFIRPNRWEGFTSLNLVCGGVITLLALCTWRIASVIQRVIDRNRAKLLKTTPTGSA